MLSSVCVGLNWGKIRQHALRRTVVILALALALLMNFWAVPEVSAVAQGWIAVDWEKNIYLIHPDGSDFHALTNDGENYSPVWSPDASQIAYVHAGNGRNTIYIMNADGTHTHPLDPQGMLANPSELTWSPDGKRIAFVGPGVPEAHDTAHIYLINSDGSHLQAIRYDIKTFAHKGWCGPEILRFFPENLQWSPDGQHLAFQVHFCEMFHNASYIMNVDGSHPVQYDVPGMRLAWSPDGQRLALAGDPIPGGVVIIVATGTSYPIDCTGDMSWSPNGQTIACTFYGSELALENADGSNFRRISQLHAWGTPTWSPDSQQLAFTATTDAQTSTLNLYVINADGTDLHAILNGNNNQLYGDVAWAPK